MKEKFNPPAIIKPQTMRHFMDCSIVCISMLTGFSYEHVEKEAKSCGYTKKKGLLHLGNWKIPKIINNLMPNKYDVYKFDDGICFLPCIAVVPQFGHDKHKHCVVIEENSKGKVIIHDPVKINRRYNSLSQVLNRIDISFYLPAKAYYGA